MPFFLALLAWLFFQSSANCQTIPDKKFTKNNSPIFIADGFLNFSGFKNSSEDGANVGNDSQLFLKSAIKTENNIKYGVIGKLEFNANSSGVRENPNLDQMFLFAEGEGGKLEIGNYVAVNQKMKSGPAEFARGARGINGKYLEAVILPKSGSFILLPQSPIGHGGYAINSENYLRKNNFRAFKDSSFDGVEDATKLSYYTPEFYGLDFGFTYTPKSSNSGLTTTKYYQNSVSTISDIFSFGASYSEDFDNLGLKISTTTEKGRVKNNANQRKDLFAYDISTTLTYFGFDLGASFGSWQNSLQKNSEIAANNSSRANYYSLGLAYSFGPISASVTNFKSRFQKNDYQALSLGLDYKLARDLMPYFEITKFEFKPNVLATSSEDAKSSRGYVFLTGFLLSF